MLLWLMQCLQSHFHGLRVLQYLTFRTLLAAMLGLLISLWLGPKVIALLEQLQLGQPVRNDGPQSHLSKHGTPTMGGTLILASLTMCLLLCGNLGNFYIWITLFVTLSYGALGFWDDYLKVAEGNSRGIRGRTKLFWQAIIALGAVGLLFCVQPDAGYTQLVIPFVKHISIGWTGVLPLLALFVIVGASNAVNLTDGLDGLAIVPIVMVGGALGIFAYLSGHIDYAHYLGIPYLAGVGELAVFCGGLVGSGLGFLWFNSYPAQIFMGDVGALSLGGALGIVAVILRQELVLFIMGGLFVVETLSVMLQVASFRLRGKRIFRMAPLHHHFELQGWPEPKVIVRFWIITAILVMCGLATLKLR